MACKDKNPINKIYAQHDLAIKIHQKCNMSAKHANNSSFTYKNKEIVPLLYAFYDYVNGIEQQFGGCILQTTK